MISYIQLAYIVIALSLLDLVLWFFYPAIVAGKGQRRFQLHLQWLLTVNLFRWVLRIPFKGCVKDQVVVLDYALFDGARLENCKLVYLGVGSLTISNRYGEGCKWSLERKAGNTGVFLKTLFHIAPELRDQTFVTPGEAELQAMRKANQDLVVHSLKTV